ncbi:MAG: hypothetical protein OXI83_09470 [Gemmatimonadota bacterium]|nr:hypothetical protein [Gemmatimonadota bacterium]
MPGIARVRRVAVPVAQPSGAVEVAGAKRGERVHELVGQREARERGDVGRERARDAPFA